MLLDSFPCKSTNDVVRGEHDEGPVYFAFPFVAMARDGSVLTYPDEDPEVLLVRSRATGKIRALPERHRGAVRAASFSTDGTRLATAGEDGTVKLWDVATLQKLGEHDSHETLVWSVAFSPTGRIVATGSADNTIALWDIQTDETARLTGHFSAPSTMDGVYSIAFSPDGSLLASGAADRTVRLWDVERRLPLVVFAGHTDEVRSVAFSPDGAVVASGSRDRSVRIWDVAARRERGVLNGHHSIVQSLSFTRDGDQLITVCFQGTVRFWDRPRIDRHDVWWMTRPVADVAISPDGQLVAAVAQQSKQVVMWRLDPSGDEHPTEPIDLDELIDAITISANGVLAIACRSGTIHLRDRDTREHLGSLDNDRPFGPTEDKPLVFSKDGRLLAMGCAAGSIRVWNMETRASYSLKQGDDDIGSLAFASDAKRLIAASDRHANAWDLTARRATEVGRHDELLTTVAVSPDGDTIVSGEEDCIQLWDSRTGAVRRTLTAGRGHRRATFLDATTVVTCEADGRLRLWDIDRGSLRFELAGHRGGVWHLDASADGTTVVSGGWDKAIRIWRAPASWSRPWERLEVNDPHAQYVARQD